MDAFLVVNIVFLWLGLIVTFLLTLTLIRQVTRILKIADNTQSKAKMLDVGSRAPAFAVSNLDGTLIKDTDFAGKAILMVFISPTCNPCKERLPELQALYPLTERAGVKLLVVSLDSTAMSQELADSHQLQIPIFALPDDATLAQDYKVSMTPSFYYLDNRRKILAAGALDEKWDALTREWKGLSTNALTPALSLT